MLMCVHAWALVSAYFYHQQLDYIFRNETLLNSFEGMHQMCVSPHDDEIPISILFAFVHTIYTHAFLSR